MRGWRASEISTHAHGNTRKQVRQVKYGAEDDVYARQSALIMLVVLGIYCIHYAHLQRAFLTTTTTTATREKNQTIAGGWAVEKDRKKVTARDRERVREWKNEREKTHIIHTDKAFLFYTDPRVGANASQV